MKISIVLASALLCMGSSALAQGTVPTEYPADAKPVPESEIATRLSGKVYTVKTISSGNWRFEFAKNGYVYLDTESGYRDTGTWRAEGGKWCANFQKTGDSCAELYAVGEVLYYKRARNGEVVAMTVR